MESKTEELHTPKKVILVGDACVGKSSILRRFTTNEFDVNMATTIGVDFHVKRIELDNCKYKVQFWDSAGQERFNAITRSFYRNADAVMIIYDVTQKDSFTHVEKWYAELVNYLPTDFEIKGVLLANKCDLPTREVTSSEGIDLATRLGLNYMETSAKDGKRIPEAFKEIFKCIHTSPKPHTAISPKITYRTLKVNKLEEKDDFPCC